LTLWDFAAEIWRRPGLEAACLALQDDDGQCVPLLLWRLWTLAERRAVSAGTVAAAVAVARGWNDSVVAPLRAIRLVLRPPRPPVDDDARLALRARLRDAELAAERALFEALEGLTTAGGGPWDAPLPALLELARAWGAPAPEERLAGLAAAL